MNRALAILCALSLTACDQVPRTPIATRTAPIFWTITTPEEIAKACGPDASACAKWIDPAGPGDICTIYTQAPVTYSDYCELAHEVRHCNEGAFHRSGAERTCG